MGSLELEVNEYHNFVPRHDHPKIQGLNHTDPHTYSNGLWENPLFRQVAQMWKSISKEKFYGVTSDGVKIEGLYSLADDGAPTRQMVTAAKHVLESLSEKELNKAQYSLASDACRKWLNTEFIVYDVGLRIETLEQSKVDLILELLRQSLSPIGFAKAQAALKTNKFLGEICESRAILNEKSYFFFITGTPSEAEPWGFTFFGHHFCLNVFVIGQQMAIGPCFIGAEPNVIDEGPDKGIMLCTREADYGLRVMQSLSAKQQRQAQIYPDMDGYEVNGGLSLPPGRWSPGDERHLAGAFQDNKVIPYEGVRVSDFTQEQQGYLLSAIEAFQELYPQAPLEARMQQIRKHFDETYFSWIGGFGPEDPFYYRIQSPVVLLEFDHHCGIFLTNDVPKKYHIHTVQRIPNGNDYGRELIRLFNEAKLEISCLVPS